MPIPTLSGDALTSLSTDQALEQIHSRPEGLSPEEVSDRLATFGANALTGRRSPP